MSGPSVEAETLARALIASVAELPGRVVGFEITVEDGWMVCACPAIPHPPFTALYAHDPGADNRLAAGLADALGGLERRGLRAQVLLAHGAFPRTQTAARGLGLSESEWLPGMVLTPPELVPPPTADGTILRVASAAGLEAVARVARASLGPTTAHVCTEAVRDTPGVAFYLAETRDGPACCALSARTGDELGIYLVGTVPEQRRRGLAAAVVARAVADGFADGVRTAYLQSSAMGYGMYRALGFREVTQELRMSRPQELV